MRMAAIGVALILAPGVAHAQENPACAKYKNDYEYNACLAKQGPKAGVSHPGVAPAHDAPAATGHGGPLVTRDKRGRVEAVFEIAPKK
jgi:hypothetical protein